MEVITSVGGWPGDVPTQARAAETTGFDCITCGELAHDSMLTMALAATATERIRLQTSVTIAFPRSPMVLAMQAWDIQHLSGGRFSLGLGSQVKGHNERRFGGTWTAPAPRMREYIQMMHAVWDSWQHGTTPEFLGKHYTFTLMTPNFNPGTPRLTSARTSVLPWSVLAWRAWRAKSRTWSCRTAGSCPTSTCGQRYCHGSDRD